MTKTKKELKQQFCLYKAIDSMERYLRYGKADVYLEAPEGSENVYMHLVKLYKERYGDVI